MLVLIFARDSVDGGWHSYDDWPEALMRCKHPEVGSADKHGLYIGHGPDYTWISTQLISLSQNKQGRSIVSLLFGLAASVFQITW